MTDKQKFVRFNDVIAALAPHLAALGGERRLYKPDEPIIRENKKHDALYFIESGNARVEWGKERFVLAMVGDGSLLGELSYLENIPHTASVVAEQECSVLIMSRAAMGQLQTQNPDIYLRFTEKLVQVLATRFRNNAEMRQQLERQKKEISDLTEQLQELDQLKSRFFANLSHEFRTPLTLILGPIDKIMEDVESPVTRKTLAGMKRNAWRLLKLVNQLLDLSKIDAGRMKLQVQENDCIPLVQGIVGSYEFLSKMRDIELHLNAPTALKLWFETDKIEAVLHNLLSNAFKFTPDGGKITVTMDVESAGKQKKSAENTFPEGNARITISDSGSGIPQEQLAHIFDRFHQVEGSAIREAEGAGIGLALVKEFVQLHHGTVKVDSSIGKGATFTLLLPLGRSLFADYEIFASPESGPLITDGEAANAVPGLAPDVAENDQLSVLTETDKPLLLLIEDNPEMLNYIRNSLRDDYRIITATDGVAGVRKAQNQVPDIIVSDVMMPKMDGYEVCKTLKTDINTSHIPVILLTAKAAQEDKQEGLETGADAYLTKPFNARELRTRIKNLIHLRRQLRDRYRRESGLNPVDVTATSIDRRFLEKIMAIIEARISDELFDVKALSKEVAMSESQLRRKLKALLNQSPKLFIRSFRLQRARQMLAEKQGSISDVAYDTGFRSLAYFTKCFREEFKQTPSEFLRG